MPILATKLFVPPPRSKIVFRPRLVERLNEGLSAGYKLSLISASAGFGKTTLVSEWIAGLDRPVAWVSLDGGDNDPARFLSYLIKALQTIQASLGEGLLTALQSPQPLHFETILTSLINEIALIQGQFLLVLDDYHAIDSQSVDQALNFIIEHQPPHMHLVIATREDPQLPLARYRAGGQCNELRAADLRFTLAEASEFLNRLTGLNLSEEDIAALETRTEGWIVGLQLAALSMQGQQDTSRFIESFTGSHHFVLDYLLEEVLHQQPESIQTFLLRTSILERMCASCCDAILQDPSIPGQATLEYLQRTNLFIVPLDEERRWYRYHHLFADLLRKRLGQSLTPGEIAGLHLLASDWYEKNGLMLEAFRQAAAANDIERAGRLIQSKKMPLHLRGTATTILAWLESLPKHELDVRPMLWWLQAAMLLVIGHPNGVEEKLLATEAALDMATQPGVPPDETARDLIGRIAAARANLAQTHAQLEIIQVQGQRALEYLHPDNLSDRSMATRSLGFGHFIQGDHAKAEQSYREALQLAQAAGDPINSVLASIRVGQIQEEGNQLYLAEETYQRILPLIDEYSPANAPVLYHGLARIYYQWNDLDRAETYAELGFKLAQQYDQVIDRLILSDIILFTLYLARGDVDNATQHLSRAERTTRHNDHTLRIQEIPYYWARLHLSQGNVDEAAQLAQQGSMPLMKARVFVAQGMPSAALPLVEQERQKAEAKEWANRLLLVKAVEAVALYANAEKDRAVKVLEEGLAMAEPGGDLRVFLDEGAGMHQLLLEASGRGVMPNFVARLLAAYEAEPSGKYRRETARRGISPTGGLPDPLSQRELEILKLIDRGLSNREIGERLYLALDTIKGHNRRIFDKLQAENRTEAVARARALGLL